MYGDCDRPLCRGQWSDESDRDDAAVDEYYYGVRVSRFRDGSFIVHDPMSGPTHYNREGEEC